MHPRTFNLLEHPNQARQQKTFHHVWTACAGILLGCGLTFTVQGWQEAQTAQMQRELNQLKAQSQALAQQAQAQAAALSQRQLLEAQLAQVHHIARHQQAWVLLHETLHQQAQQAGLRLTRWTTQDGQMQWQGHMDRFDAMAAARQSLAQQLEQPVLLVSTNTGADQGVEFVWQTLGPPTVSADAAGATVSKASVPNASVPNASMADASGTASGSAAGTAARSAAAPWNQPRPAPP